MKAGHCAAIVLAAGLSSRMTGFKPLLPVGEGTIVDHVISTFIQNGTEVYVVVGHRQDEVRAAIEKWDVHVIENPDYERGMFTSVQAGVRALRPEHTQFSVIPVDVPLVRSATVARLIIEGEQRPGKVIYPVFAGRRGHPPLIPASLIPSILEWQQEGGLRAVLSDHAKDSVELPTADSNILFDVDTPEDYQELLERFGHLDVPTEEECHAILNDICRVAPDIRDHGAKVAEVASVMARALGDAGLKLDVEKVDAAALVHDLAKGRPEHDIEAARMLRDMGFAGIADIVAVHTDLPESRPEASAEAKIVYLADKFVSGKSLVTLDERYSPAGRRFAVTPEVEAAIMQRKRRALAVKGELESHLGRPLESLLSK